MKALPDALKHLADALDGTHKTLKNGDETTKEIIQSSPPPGTGGA